MIQNREIKYPIWENTEKTRIKCQFHYEDGSQVEATVMDTEEGNPDWKEIMDLFGVEGVEASHQKYLAERAIHMKKREAEDKEKAEIDKASMLFSAKLEAFEVKEVKSSKDRKIKSRIRKASSFVEIQALTAVLIMKELNNEEKEAE